MKRATSICFCSGKGGVGKSTLVAGLGLTLREKNKRTLMIDANFGLSNLDLLLQVRAEETLIDLLSPNRNFEDVKIPIQNKLDLVTGGTSLSQLVRLTHLERRTLLEKLKSVEFFYDFLLIDSAPGLGDDVFAMCMGSDEIVVVVTPDGTSFRDAYALIKVLYKNFGKRKFNLIVNEVKSLEHGISLYSRFSEITQRFLSVGMDYLGSISEDEKIRGMSRDQGLDQFFVGKNKFANELNVVANALLQKQKTMVEAPSVFWEQAMGVA